MTVRLLVCTLFACGPRIIQVPTNGVQDVRITELPNRASCYIEDPPEAPELLEIIVADEDVIHRTTIHVREYNTLQQWALDMVIWVGTVRSCIYQLTGQEP